MISIPFKFTGAAMLLSFCLVPVFDAGADKGQPRLQRLFTEPETRARLDAVRKGETIIDESVQEQQATRVRVDGLVIRENGDNVVWVNGESTLDSNSLDGFDVQTRGAGRYDYRVPIRVDDRILKLKPGQVWSSDNGRIRDDY